MSRRSKTVFKRIGLHPERNLGGDVADFYLLESIIGYKRNDGLRGDVYDGDGMAITLFERHVAEVAKEFSAYLDMAVGGEVRHGFCWPSRIEPFDGRFTREYLMPCNEHEFSRSFAWDAWMRARRKAPKATLPWLRQAARAFTSYEWKGDGVGGDGWALAARVTFDYLSGTLRARTFVDRAFTIQHNNGHIFDKTYGNLKDLTKALEEQAAGDYRALSVRATPFVARRWRNLAARSRVWQPTVEAPVSSD